MTHFLASFSQRIDQIQSHHRAFVDRPWLVLPSGRLYVALILLLSMAAVFANFHVRSQQFSYWQSQPDIFFVEDTPLFSTMDAGYFLGIAQSLSRQDTPHDFEARRSFPDGRNSAQNVADVTPAKAPLLSSLIYWLADNDSPQALLETGHAVIPITAAITALAIILCFGATGYWLEGSVAAVGGGLCMAYLQRSSIGRIDTDQLNLGFFYLLFGLAIWAGRAKNWQISLGLTILAGLTARLFMAWYDKSELIWMSLFALFWMLLVCSRDWQRAGGFSILFILLSGVQIVDIGGSAYIKESFATGAQHVTADDRLARAWRHRADWHAVLGCSSSGLCHCPRAAGCVCHAEFCHWQSRHFLFGAGCLVWSGIHHHHHRARHLSDGAGPNKRQAGLASS